RLVVELAAVVLPHSSMVSARGSAIKLLTISLVRAPSADILMRPRRGLPEVWMSHGEFMKKLVIGILGAIFGSAATVLLTQCVAGEDVDRLQAERFMIRYYDTVVEDPLTVWDTMVSRELRDAHEGGYEEFRSAWARWSGVEYERVVPLQDSRNWFSVRVAYVDRDGQQQSYRPIQFRLVCVDRWANRLPVLTCDTEDLRLRDAYNSPNL
ncbi:hypothetical protein, partial [Geodermatophilus chilensis]|uniref:hypothetical protein n=1 Tax=Geodermatophilus chilensis TaxID=2035835 RepID=UPI001E37AC08